MYVSWVFGDRLRIVMSSIMRWRRAEIGFVIGELLSTGLHKRAILADRRLLTDDPTPIELIDGATRPMQLRQTKRLNISTINTLNLDHLPLPRAPYRRAVQCNGSYGIFVRTG